LVTPRSLSGNYGLLDQREAFNFLKANIKYFGGDPNQITVFGQSAGATSIAVHLVSPKSKGLFNKAIIQSNPTTLPMKTTVDASNSGKFFLQITGCQDSLQCLQSLTTDEILDAQEQINKKVNFRSVLETFYPWTPTLDGKEFTKNPLESIQLGNYQRMPIMLGAVHDEALLFIYKASKNEINDVEYIGAVEYVFGLYTGFTVLERYPPTPIFGDKRPALGSLGTDYIFLCPIRNMTLNFAKDTSNPVFLYHYDHTISFANKVWPPNFTECEDYVCHAEDLLTLWGTPPLGGFGYTDDEKRLSSLLINYWVNFARNGDPNVGIKVPQWSKYTSKDMKNLLFKTPNSGQESSWKDTDCDFFDTVGYHHGWRK